MASGHVNRAQRPNTWLHRPSLRREESSCQLGAVHTWPESDMPRWTAKVRLAGVMQTSEQTSTSAVGGSRPDADIEFLADSDRCCRKRAGRPLRTL